MFDLTDSIIENAPRPEKGAALLNDGAGLRLRLSRTAASWQFKYRVRGKERTASLGEYPGVGIVKARRDADRIREQVEQGIDPGKAQQEEKVIARTSASLTFKVIADEWLAYDDTLAERTRTKRGWLVDMMHKLHAIPAAEVKPSDVRTVLQAIQGAGDKRESAHRAGQVCAAIYDHAITNHEDIIKSNPAQSRKGWLRPVAVEHHAALTDPKAVGLFVALVDGGVFDYGRLPTVANALRFLLRTAVRQKELIGARWSEMHGLDSDRPEWRIPAERMKGRRGKRKAFTVPLSRQAVAILERQRAVSDDRPYVFPGANDRNTHMSNMAIGKHLEILGYGSDQQTTHGVRTIFATLARNDLRADGDLVELSLSHEIGNAVRAAYDRADRLEERRELMQKWADHLDKLAEQATARAERQFPGPRVSASAIAPRA